MFESALLDAITSHMPYGDQEIVIGSLRRIARYLADRFVSPLEADPRSPPPFARKAFERLVSSQLPREIDATRPEGFAYWGLYPEQFVDAARRFFEAVRPTSVIIIGVRSIGTPLSSVVDSCLAAKGVSTFSFCVRPSGHPFARNVQFAPREVETLLRTNKEHVLIVDEGPGLSGSTMTSIARALSDLGIDASRIVLFPSYETEGTSFVNEQARQIWRQHTRFVGTFDPIQLLSGATDLSCGLWRTELNVPGLESLPVVPHHERRKYLERSRRGTPIRIYRYCGLGPAGDLVHTRALALQNSGFVPRVRSKSNGLMEVDFAPGQPIVDGKAPPGLLENMAAYLAFRDSSLRTTTTQNTLNLVRMSRTNVEEGIGEEYVEQVDVLAELAADGVERSCCVDGRMQPNEWISSGAGYTKVDAFDHGDDHFFPGICNIAWDIAGAAVEFALSDRELAILVGSYVKRTGDDSITRRLPFYTAAYLAFRMGYCALTEATLGTEVERRRIAELGWRYRTCLRTLLSRRQ